VIVGHRRTLRKHQDREIFVAVRALISGDFSLNATAETAKALEESERIILYWISFDAGL
jgi:hypothetical protein